MSSILKIDEQGNKKWYLNDLLHRDNDLPAIEYTDGDKYWYINNLLHRENYLPAIEHANGDKEWWIHGELHRENGPAIEKADGDKEWWLNGIESPWLEEILKTKARLDENLFKNESIKSKRKI